MRTHPRTRRGRVDNYEPPPGAPLVPGSNQPGWGGYVFASTSAPVTSITASFTIPTLSGQTGSDCSIWVGIGNVMQTGIYSTYNTGSTGNNDTIAPWTWFISGNGASEFWDPAVYTLTAGDSMTLTLALSATFWTATQVNHTAGWNYANATPVLATGVATSTWEYPYNTGEVIIENENTNLPNYGTLTFSSIAMVPAINATYIDAITTVNTSTDQTPGAYSAGSFTMTWSNYS